MADQRIVVTVRADGSVLAETLGVAGPACLASIELLEGLLEAETVDSSYTADYYYSTAAETSTTYNDQHRVRQQMTESD